MKKWNMREIAGNSDKYFGDQGNVEQNFWEQGNSVKVNFGELLNLFWGTSRTTVNFYREQGNMHPPPPPTPNPHPLPWESLFHVIHESGWQRTSVSDRTLWSSFSPFGTSFIQCELGGFRSSFGNRTGTSVDDGARKSNNWLDQWQSGKLGTGSRV